MDNRQAAFALLADDRATAAERRAALMLVAGSETPKARDELMIAEWFAHQRAA